MTCGGIIFIALILSGGYWLSDQLNEDWPLGVAGIIVALLIVWRIFEFIYVRIRAKREMDAFDRAFAPTPIKFDTEAKKGVNTAESPKPRWCDVYVRDHDNVCRNCGVPKAKHR